MTVSNILEICEEPWEKIFIQVLQTIWGTYETYLSEAVNPVQLNNLEDIITRAKMLRLLQKRGKLPLDSHGIRVVQDNMRVLWEERDCPAPSKPPPTAER